jgi:WhiB family redox-sensing transcriptional regulator
MINNKIPRLTQSVVPLEMPTPRTMDNTPCQSTDPETFFPDPTELEKIATAKSFCAKCEGETKTKCLSFAMKNRIRYGVWGGLTEIERYKLVRQQRRAK